MQCFWSLKYRGPILRVTWSALGSNDLNLDQSGTSIQILLEPNAGHVTHFFKKITTLNGGKYYFFESVFSRCKGGILNPLHVEKAIKIKKIPLSCAVTFLTNVLSRFFCLLLNGFEAIVKHIRLWNIGGDTQILNCSDPTPNS